jgi:non-ribosomal peptide synthetase component F
MTEARESGICYNCASLWLHTSVTSEVKSLIHPCRRPIILADVFCERVVASGLTCTHQTLPLYPLNIPLSTRQMQRILMEFALTDLQVKARSPTPRHGVTATQRRLFTGDSKTMTYSEVLAEVSRVANWLAGQGVQEGDSIAIYLPMVLELPIAMLACARLGAVHSVVFGGFSSDSLASRIMDSKPNVLITASGVMRGTKVIPLKQIADDACAACKSQGHEVRAVACLFACH